MKTSRKKKTKTLMSKLSFFEYFASSVNLTLLSSFGLKLSDFLALSVSSKALCRELSDPGQSSWMSPISQFIIDLDSKSIIPQKEINRLGIQFGWRPLLGRLGQQHCSNCFGPATCFSTLNATRCCLKCWRCLDTGERGTDGETQTQLEHTTQRPRKHIPTDINNTTPDNSRSNMY